MAGQSLGTAYVQIVPTMKGGGSSIAKQLDSATKNSGKQIGSRLQSDIGASLSKVDASGVGDSLGAGVSKAGATIKGVAGTLAKAGVAAGAAIGTAAAAMGKQALDAYANYEQLAGGVEKLYGSAADAVKKNAQEAYKTSGMSANQYMEQATSFSAALVKSLGGDQQKAAEQTDVAMRAISDNVNVFGSNMEDVQNAYQGFAKQNYTMLTCLAA